MSGSGVLKVRPVGPGPTRMILAMGGGAEIGRGRRNGGAGATKLRGGSGVPH